MLTMPLPSAVCSYKAVLAIAEFIRGVNDGTNAAISGAVASMSIAALDKGRCAAHV